MEPANVPPRARLTWLVGPPGAGKSTFAASRAHGFERVVELTEMLGPLVGPAEITDGVLTANGALVALIRALELREGNLDKPPVLVVAGLVERSLLLPVRPYEAVWLLRPPFERWMTQLRERPVDAQTLRTYSDYPYAQEWYARFGDWCSQPGVHAVETEWAPERIGQVAASDIPPEKAGAMGATTHGLVGGAADVLGPWQLSLLVRHGLRPDHRLLDLGCGTLRGGRFVIPYLNPGGYVGVDPIASLIERAWEVVDRETLWTWRPTLGSLELLGESANRTFDFVLAQSVLNHLGRDDIVSTVARVARVLAPRGVWLATARLDTDVAEVLEGPAHPHRPGEYLSVHMNPEWFRSLLGKHNLTMRREPDSPHPRGLTVLSVRREA